MDLADYRREFTREPLLETDVSSTPDALFNLWLEQAQKALDLDSNAMVLASVDEHNNPFQRIVLLKDFNPDSLIFYTNLTSRKAQHLAHNKAVNVLFPWHSISRQVAFSGTVSPVDNQTAETYFHSRPRLSQIGAWASKQSTPISSRAVLEEKFNAIEQQFKDVPVPKPDFWGGYQIHYHSVEFWQGRPCRLHDRFLYTKQADASWRLQRLSP